MEDCYGRDPVGYVCEMFNITIPRGGLKQVIPQSKLVGSTESHRIMELFKLEKISKV